MLSAFDYGYRLDNVPAAIRGTRRPVDQIDLETSWLSIVHALLAIGGLWTAATTPASRLLVAPVLTLLASTVLFFGYVRLGVAYLPVVWIFQAFAITRVLNAIPVGPRVARRAEFAAIALVVVLLLIERSAVSQRRVLLLDGLVDEAGRLVEDQKLEISRVR
jgi:hypothetical protein